MNQHDSHELIILHGTRGIAKVGYLACVTCKLLVGSALKPCRALTTKGNPCQGFVRTDLGYDYCKAHNRV